MAANRRSRQIFLRGAIVAAAASAAVVLLLARTSGFRRLENITYDERAVLTAKPAEADKRIVIIDVDNASFDALKSQFGRWPWSRSVWSGALYYIEQGHPSIVVFDAIYSGAESAEVDNEFAQQIAYYKNVVLAYTFTRSDETSGEDPEERAAKLALLAREASPIEPNTLGELLTGNIALNTPLDILANSAAGLGTANADIDRDGILRRFALGYRVGDKVYPSLSARTADLVLHGAEPHRSAPFVRRGRYAVHDGWTVPVDDDGKLLMRWHGNSDVYERIPIWNLLCSQQPDQCPDVKRTYPSSYFKDKIVMIGASATASYEVRATPFDGSAPGFVSQVTAIDNLIQHDAMRVPPRWYMPFAVILLAALGAVVLVAITSASISAVVFGCVLGAYILLTWLAYGHLHLWLPLVAPSAALVLSFASTGTLRYATTGRELRKTRGTLNRYMAPQLVDYVLANVDNLNFAGEKRELTIFFSDVRNFTTLTEKSDPLVLIQMLNEYLTEMTDCIFKYDGVVDKFIGDGILAYWGAFTPGNHALLGAQSALEMFDRLKELNARWKEKGWPEIDIGVGLNTGEVIFGNVGAGKKIEFTVIGDPVNLASRLESENKPQHTHIIISEFTLAKLGDIADVRPLGGVKVKGKTIETQIYELKGLRRTEPAPTAVTAEVNA